ncbi:EscI/YscI/HrpB family type III secretion system inner rod protein [Roseateles amylovorans]|uniref:EscI/YscI/HrpB family type III secretion system inner rod protein n=1 Tax=Roseateles amylovorans TaxID=2978473 RepID=A0ABY6B2A1_9BURK|nr:EscI/YscI/HrpB family type III secretion system inner rod protein [Roseateles amylovorans]UXH79533.1 EscI/YscI/HrpB family type III secretion system inner rod protein [Roseateles amylovorans]
MASAPIPNRVVLPHLPTVSTPTPSAATSAFARAVAEVGGIEGSLVAARHRSPQDVQGLSDVLGGPGVERRHLANRLNQMLRSGNTRDVPAITARMLDMSTQSDIVAKVVGKTVSAVDQLTKLS